MESSAIQLRLILTSIAFGITMSCHNQSKDNQNYTESIDIETSNGTLNGCLSENQLAVNLLDGVTAKVGRDKSDNIELTYSITDAIGDDNLLKKLEIVGKSRKKKTT